MERRREIERIKKRGGGKIRWSELQKEKGGKSGRLRERLRDR
jgi:hypothetical protein